MIRLVAELLDWIYPPKCVLCGEILGRNELDLCHQCRENAPEYSGRKGNIPFVDHTTALWYYENQVRESIHRYKFQNRRCYSQSYGRLLAMKVIQEFEGQFDLITWIPVSSRRRHRRGYDQVELIAKAMGKELMTEPVASLVKYRNTKPNSSLNTAAERKANVLGAYRLQPGIKLDGKKVLMLDDVLTTGATASECARMLALGGAKEIRLATIAAVRKG